MNNKLITNQIEISLKELGAFTNGDLAFHQMHGHSIMAWSPLGGGDLLTGNGKLRKYLMKLPKKSGRPGRNRVAFISTSCKNPTHPGNKQHR